MKWTEYIIGGFFGGLAIIAFFINLFDWLKLKLKHKHSLYVTRNPHSPVGNTQNHVIKCGFCGGTWDMTGSDFYGTSTLLKGGKIRKHLLKEEHAQLLLNFAKSEKMVTEEQFTQLNNLVTSKPEEVLKMFGL